MRHKSGSKRHNVTVLVGLSVTIPSWSLLSVIFHASQRGVYPSQASQALCIARALEFPKLKLLKGYVRPGR